MNGDISIYHSFLYKCDKMCQTLEQLEYEVDQFYRNATTLFEEVRKSWQEKLDADRYFVRCDTRDDLPEVIHMVYNYHSIQLRHYNLIPLENSEAINLHIMLLSYNEWISYQDKKWISSRLRTIDPDWLHRQDFLRRNRRIRLRRTG